MSMEKPSGSLDSLLRELAQDDARHGTSVEVQARLLSEVRSIAAHRRLRSYRAVVALTVAAACVAGVLMVIPRSTTPGSPPVASPAPPLRETATAFLPLPGATAPPADAYIVRLELPRAALVRFGLGQTETLISPRARNTVLADLLVGEDGLARAVRFVHQE